MPVYPVPHALCVPVHKVDIHPLGAVVSLAATIALRKLLF